MTFQLLVYRPDDLITLPPPRRAAAVLCAARERRLCLDTVQAGFVCRAASKERLASQAAGLLIPPPSPARSATPKPPSIPHNFSPNNRCAPLGPFPSIETTCTICLDVQTRTPVSSQSRISLSFLPSVDSSETIPALHSFNARKPRGCAWKWMDRETVLGINTGSPRDGRDRLTATNANGGGWSAKKQKEKKSKGRESGWRQYIGPADRDMVTSGSESESVGANGANTAINLSGCPRIEVASSRSTSSGSCGGLLNPGIIAAQTFVHSSNFGAAGIL